jgi:hypothetical protein
MTRLRFATAREVFEAFPSARDDVEAGPSDDPPLVFAERLARGPTPEAAIGFCAYLLPRREAVWWACQCVRALMPALTREEAAAIEAAEAWVREPEHDRRRAALAIGTSGQQALPATWVALAAAWSGGSMVEGEHAVPAPPHLTAKAARIAVLTALARVAADQRTSQIRACLDRGLRLAGGPPASAH